MSQTLTIKDIEDVVDALKPNQPTVNRRFILNGTDKILRIGNDFYIPETMIPGKDYTILELHELPEDIFPALHF